MLSLHFPCRPGKAEYLQSAVSPPIDVQDPCVEGVTGSDTLLRNGFNILQNVLTELLEVKTSCNTIR